MIKIICIHIIHTLVIFLMVSVVLGIAGFPVYHVITNADYYDKSVTFVSMFFSVVWAVVVVVKGFTVMDELL